MRSSTTQLAAATLRLGSSRRFNLTTGSNNIDIGNEGVAGESNTIRIGKKERRQHLYRRH